jgi:hypothetical protein
MLRVSIVFGTFPESVIFFGFRFTANFILTRLFYFSSLYIYDFLSLGACALYYLAVYLFVFNFIINKKW